MTRAVRIAVAGAGMVSAHHLAAWSKLANAEVVGICDPERGKAEERARRFGIAHAFTDAAEMLDKLRPDVIDIAAPVGAHAALARLAAERGIDVLCQKPLTPTLAESKALLAEIDGPVRAMVNETWRFRMPYRKARDWIQRGRLGRVRRFAIAAESSGLVVRRAGEPPPALLRQPFLASLERLIVFELLVHHLDLARSLCGELTVVAARLGRGSPLVRGEDRAVIILEGAGVIGTVSGDFSVPGRAPAITDTLAVIGDDAAISFDGARLVLHGPGGVLDEEAFGAEEIAQSGYDGSIAHFLACRSTGATFETSFADHLRSFALVEQVYASSTKRDTSEQGAGSVSLS